jgi:hypothetical protein
MGGSTTPTEPRVNNTEGKNLTAEEPYLSLYNLFGDILKTRFIPEIPIIETNHISSTEETVIS